MISVAITGSFAVGKSFVLNYIEKFLNYKVFSCDNYVSQLLNDINIQTKVLTEIKSLKVFDKKKILSLICYKEVYKKNLEQLIHPMVKSGIFNFKNLFCNEDILFFEVPLLFETDFYKYFDYSICLYCSEEVRLQRASKKSNFNYKTYKMIENYQISQSIKSKKANFTVNTEHDCVILFDKINNIIKKIL